MERTDFNNLSQALAHAETARSLDLSSQGLRKLPPTLAKLTRLESLDISVNPLGDLPEALFGLTNLRRLRIGATGLKSLPAALGRLEQLTELGLGGFDDYETLPDALSRLRRLQTLDLTDATGLKTLPDWLADLPELRELRLIRVRRLSNAAATVAGMPHLRALSMVDTRFSGFSQRPVWAPTLQRLELSETQISVLPEWLAEMQALESLRMEDNPDLQAIPASLGALRNLRSLYLGGQGEPFLPAELGHLARLEELSLVQVGLSAVPEWVFGLGQLTTVYLGLNPIVRVAPGIARLSRLRELDFGYNPDLAPMRRQIADWLPQCRLLLEGDDDAPSPPPEPMAVSDHDAPPPVAEPAAVSSRRDSAAAAGWPEFASLAAWQALAPERQAASAAAIARALGPNVEVLSPAGAHGLPRLMDGNTGFTFVVIAGGRYEMGLRDAEREAMQKLTRRWSAEARAHARDLAALAGPPRTVDIPPFLCAQSPVTAAQATGRTEGVETAGPVRLFTAGAAAEFAGRAFARLLSESEWEYVARDGGTRAWLGVDGPVTRKTLLAAAERAVAEDLETPGTEGFGVRGLAWGTWVADAWRPDYAAAPADGSARAPGATPETVRGGALLSWPWQVDGEALLMHVAHRDRGAQRAGYPLLLARDLPPAREGW